MINAIIGAANFFRTYGVTQANSSIKNIEEILSSCTKHKIETIDTAINYEYNNQQKNISRDLLSKFDIGTKISIKENNLKKRDLLDKLLKSLNSSLKNWGKNEFKYIYCHDILEKKNEIELFKEISEILKEEGFTKQMGLSIYDTNDINSNIIESIDRIQIPDNLYLQRPYEEILFFKKFSLCIDVRSIFLQGIIPNEIINFKKTIPNLVINHQKKVILESKKRGIKMYDLAVNYIKNMPYSNIVIGVDKSIQIKEFFNSINKNINIDNLKSFKLDSPLVDPRKW